MKLPFQPRVLPTATMTFSRSRESVTIRPFLNCSNITVKGNDVTGVILQLNKLGAIAGSFRLEPMPPAIKEQCKDDKK